jgi:hypothetical protein
MRTTTQTHALLFLRKVMAPYITSLGCYGHYIVPAGVASEIKAHGHLLWVVHHGHVQMQRKFVILGALCGHYPDVGRRCSRARALPHYKWRAETFKRVAETGPRLANVVGKGRLSLTDFLPEVQK